MSWTSHAVLTPADALYLPAGQSVQAVLTPADALYLPAGQLVQAALPVRSLYLPATQFVHGPPLGPVLPLAQGAQLVAEQLLVCVFTPIL